MGKNPKNYNIIFSYSFLVFVFSISPIQRIGQKFQSIQIAQKSISSFIKMDRLIKISFDLLLNFVFLSFTVNNEELHAFDREDIFTKQDHINYSVKLWNRL